MPALEGEIEQAIEEGVKLMPSWGPVRVTASKGKVDGIELVRCRSVFDSKDNFERSKELYLQSKYSVYSCTFVQYNSALCDKLLQIS